MSLIGSGKRPLSRAVARLTISLISMPLLIAGGDDDDVLNGIETDIVGTARGEDVGLREKSGAACARKRGRFCREGPVTALIKLATMMPFGVSFSAPTRKTRAWSDETAWRL